MNTWTATVGLASEPPGESEEGTARRQGALVAERYLLGPLIGRGSSGSVFQATDQILGETVALKILRQHRWTSSPLLRRELVALRGVHLPGVARLLDDGPVEGGHFIAMELVEGEPFPSGLPPVSWSSLAPLARRLLEVVATLHEIGLVHRDLKPANTVVRAGTGEVVVLDLGLAVGAAGLAFDGGLAFTQDFAPPEIARGAVPSPAGDLYSVGVMLYLALSGKLPFELHGARRNLALRALQPPPPVRERLPDLPPAVSDLIQALLQPDPEARPQSAWEALERIGGPTGHLLGLPALPVARRAADLRGIIAGPDPFLHLQEDGAAALFARTGGDPDALRSLLEALLRTGQAALVDGYVQLDRHRIDALQAGERVGRDGQAPEGADQEIWQALALAFPDATAGLVAAAMALPTEEVEGAIQRLCAARHAWPLPDGNVGVAPIRAGGPGGPLAALQEALGRALPTGHPGSLRLLGPLQEEPAALAALAEQSLSWPGIRPGQARAGLIFALGVARANEDHESEAGLLRRLAALSLADEDPRAADLALYELGRVREAIEEQHAIEVLLRAAIEIWRGRPDTAALAGGMDQAFLDPQLERWRMSLLSILSLRYPSTHQEEALESATRWAGEDPERKALLLGWRGLLSYSSGHFREAAQLHEAALACKTTSASRVSSLRNAAAAWLEAGQPRLAERRALEAQELARTHRLSRIEALATWCLRAARSRLDIPQEADEALGDAALEIHLVTGAQVLLGESIIAWKAGALGKAASLAHRSEQIYGGLGFERGRVLARLVELLARGAGPEEAEALVRAARGLNVPGLHLQVVGLLGQALGRADWLLEARTLLTQVFPSSRDHPLELGPAGSMAGSDPLS